MLIKIKHRSDCSESEVTDKNYFLNRRAFMQTLCGGVILGSGMQWLGDAHASMLANINSSPYSSKERPTPLKDITHYNNFYEFGTGKEDPARKAKNFKTRPWQVTVEGEVEHHGTYDFDELIKAHPLEERIYRLRCVETWSMVVPWVGFPLGDLIKRFKPTSKAKFVEFTTLYDPKQMPGQRQNILKWPYVEGLRIDEAMHPLTLLAVGLYGENLPPQNGAPLRLVIPWKYGFKSIKSIVKIRLLENQPINTWQASAPNEYGFYANVNPNVDHPRWSQKKERRIGDFLKRETLMFNGYAEEVGALYTGMDLNKYF